MILPLSMRLRKSVGQQATARITGDDGPAVLAVDHPAPSYNKGLDAMLLPFMHGTALSSA